MPAPYFLPVNGVVFVGSEGVFQGKYGLQDRGFRPYPFGQSSTVLLCAMPAPYFLPVNGVVFAGPEGVEQGEVGRQDRCDHWRKHGHR